METESGAKIAIRGKGSVKEGKGRSDAAHTSNQEEDLHCLIMADTEEKVNKAKRLIHNVIETVSWNFDRCVQRQANSARLPPFRKARMNLSAISSVSSPPSTVPSVMTRTKHAKTVSDTLLYNRLRSHSRNCRWPNRSSQVRLSRATQLHRQHHLPRLWQRRTHGTRLS